MWPQDLGGFSTHGLMQAIPRLIAALGPGANLSTLSAACGVLRRAATAEVHRKSKRMGGDLSTMWRPSIEGAAGEDYLERANYLVDFVRDLALAMLDTDQRGEDVIRMMLKENSGIVRRIAVWILSVRLSFAPSSTRAVLSRPDRWEGYACNREFWQLAHVVSLQDSSMTQGLTAKLAGRLAVRQGHWQRMGATPDQIKDRSEHWLHEKLHLLRKGLADPERIELEGLDKTRGELTHDPLAVRSRQSYQVGSPLSSDEILTKSPKEIVEFASSYSDPSMRTDVFALYSAKWSQAVSLLNNQQALLLTEPPILSLQGLENVAAVLGGFELAVLNQKRFNWVGVLRLINWVISCRLQSSDGDPRAAWAGPGRQCG